MAGFNIAAAVTTILYGSRGVVCSGRGWVQAIDQTCPLRKKLEVCLFIRVLEQAVPRNEAQYLPDGGITNHVCHVVCWLIVRWFSGPSMLHILKHKSGGIFRLLDNTLY